MGQPEQDQQDQHEEYEEIDELGELGEHGDMNLLENLDEEIKDQDPTGSTSTVTLASQFLYSQKRSRRSSPTAKHSRSPVSEDVRSLVRLIKFATKDYAVADEDLYRILLPYKNNDRALTAFLASYIRDGKTFLTFQIMRVLVDRLEWLPTLEILGRFLSLFQRPLSNEVFQFIVKQLKRHEGFSLQGTIWRMIQKLYARQMTCLIKEQDVDAAHAVFLELKESDVRVNTLHYNILVHGFGSVKRYAEAHQLFSELQKSGLPYKTLSTFNTILVLLRNQGDVAGCLRLLKHMREIGITPGDRTYVIVLYGCFEQEPCDIDVVNQLCDEYLASHKPSEPIPAHLLRTMVKGYVKHSMPEKARSILDNCSNMNSRFIEDQNALIESFLDVGDIEGMVNAHRNLCSMKLRESTRTFNLILTGLMRQKNYTLAHEILETFRKLPHFKMDHYTSTLAAAIETEAKGVDAALKLLKSKEHMHVKSQHAYCAILQRCKVASAVTRVFSHLQASFEPSFVSWNKLLRQYGWCGDWEHIQQTRKHMREKHILVSDSTCTSVLNNFDQNSAPIEVVESFWNSLQRDGFQFSSAHYLVLLRCRARVNDVAGANVIFSKLKSIHSSSAPISRHLLRACEVLLQCAQANNDLQAAYQFFEEGKLHGTPTLNMYTLMCNAFLQAGEARAATKLFNEMRQLGYTPSPMLEAALQKVTESTG